MKYFSLLLLFAFIFLGCHDDQSNYSEGESIDNEVIVPIGQKEEMELKPDSLPRVAEESIEESAEIKVDSSDFKFGFVIDNQYLIISSAPSLDWADGRAYDHSLENHTIAIADVDMTVIPANYIGLLNEKLIASTSDGKQEVVQVKNFKLISVFVPHFGMKMNWEQQLEDGEITEEQITDDIWRTGVKFLVAEFQADSGRSMPKGLEYALPYKEEPSYFFSTTQKQDSLGEFEVLVSNISVYQSIQEQAKDLAGQDALPWWEGEAIALYNASNDRMYAAISHEGGDLCGGDFYATTFSLWMEKDSLWELEYITENDVSVISALDIDNDSVLEFIVYAGFKGDKSLLKKVNGEWEMHEYLVIPNYNCGC